MPSLQDLAGVIVLLFMAAIGATIIFYMLIGKEKGIDLKFLISEENGQASMSRFQLLVFTFVIAMGLLISVLDSGQFPNIDSDVFALLGISAGSYVGAKIAQKTAKPDKPGEVRPAAPDRPNQEKPAAGQGNTD